MLILNLRGTEKQQIILHNIRKQKFMVTMTEMKRLPKFAEQIYITMKSTRIHINIKYKFKIKNTMSFCRTSMFSWLCCEPLIYFRDIW